MVSKKTAILLTFLLISFSGIAFARLANATQLDTCRIGSADPYGAERDVFSPSNDVYANGTGFPPSSLVDIWVVNHTAWSDGMKIPSDGILTTVSTDGSGNILPTMVWHAPLVPGLYDIVADVDRDGYYNATKDCLDASGCQVAAGLFVLPEYILGTVAGAAGCFAALGVYRLSKRRKL